jgi:tetratricopeptide (TPR) repeat protein
VEFAAWDSAKTLAAHAVELTAPEALVDRARRRQAQGVATASATGIDQALPLLHEAIEEFRAGGSREGIADAAWALGNLLRAKTLFAQAEQLANDLLAEVGGDDAATARLLLMRSHAALNARDDHALARADAGRALELLRGDRLELDALHLVAQVEAEAEGSNDEAWRQVAELATARQAWNIAANAIRQRGAILVDDEPYAALAFIDEAEELAQQHGLVEAGAWCDYMRAEAFLSSGDWDDAVAAGLRAIEVGEAHDMHRPVVRSWFALRPIAVARGDLALLAQAYPRFAARAGVEPDSPYARIVSTAMHVSFADAGLERHFVPDVEQRLRSFELDHTSPSWLAAIETIVGAWITAGELDGARRALDVMRARLSRGSPTRLALVTHAVLRARRGEPIAPDVATESPWWRWKVLRELDPSSAEAEMIALRLRLER